MLPRCDWQGPRLQQLQAELTDGSLKTDTFTDPFGSYPDLPFVEDLPSVCQADRCIVLEAQINALQVKIHTYRSHLGNALVHFAVYPRHPGMSDLPRLVCEPGQIDLCSFDDSWLSELRGMCFSRFSLVPNAPDCGNVL